MSEVSNTQSGGCDIQSSMQCGGCEKPWDMSDHRPLVLPCGHCSCNSCVTTQRTAGKLICRHCPHTFLEPWTPDTETPVNYFILELIQSKNGVEQSNGIVSTSSIAVPGLVKEPENHKGMCVDHKLYKTFRCTVCSVDVCQQCAEECHSMESCQVLSINQDVHLNELASETKQVVSKQSAICQKKLDQISKCKSLLDSEQKLIKEQIKTIQAEINKHNQVYETILREKELLDLKILRSEISPYSNSEEQYIPDETASNYAQKVMSEVSCCLVIRGNWQYLYGGVVADRSNSEMHEDWNYTLGNNDWGELLPEETPSLSWEGGILEETDATGNQEERDDSGNSREQSDEQENENVVSVDDNNVSDSECIVNDAIVSSTLTEGNSHDNAENEDKIRLNSNLNKTIETEIVGSDVAELEVQVGECSSSTSNDIPINSCEKSNLPEVKESNEPEKDKVASTTDHSNTETPEDESTVVIQGSEDNETEISNQNNNIDSTDCNADNGVRNNSNENENEENNEQNVEESIEDNGQQSNNSTSNADNNEVEEDADESGEESEEGNAEQGETTDENQDKALWPHCFSDRYRIEVLVSIAGAVEPTRSVVWCVWRNCNGEDKTLWARLTIRDGLLHLHHLQDNPPPPDSLLLMHDMVKSSISRVDSIQRCFLDLSWAGKERGRVYIEVHQRYTNPASLLKQLIQHFSGERTPYTEMEIQLKDKHFVTLGDCSNWKVAPNKLLDRRSYFTGMLFVPENSGAVTEKTNLSVNPVVPASHTQTENQADNSASNENADTSSSNHISDAEVQVNATSDNIVASDLILATSTTDAMPTSNSLLDNFNSDQAVQTNQNSNQAVQTNQNSDQAVQTNQNSDQTVQTNQNQEETKSSSSSPPPSPTAAAPSTSNPEPPNPPLGLAILLRGCRISPPGPCLGSVTSGLSILLAAAAAVSAKHKVKITQCGLADNKCFEFYGQ